jgi:hypothetical protein
MTRLRNPWAVVFVVGACSAPPLSLRPEPRSFTGGDYERVYEAWTREAHDFAFRRLSNVLHVTATFQSYEFRWAYVVRYAEDHGLQTDYRTDMLRASLDDARDNHRFFVTLAGQDFRESDLTHHRSAWRVLLVDEHGEQTIPVEIEKVRRPGAAERAYFPSVSPQRHAFRVAFPARRPDGSETIPHDTRSVILRFTGAAGTVDLAWEFRDPDGA